MHGPMCFNDCKKNYTGCELALWRWLLCALDGPLCWQRCPLSFPFACGRICTISKQECNTETLQIDAFGMDMLKGVGELGSVATRLLVSWGKSAVVGDGINLLVGLADGGRVKCTRLMKLISDSLGSFSDCAWNLRLRQVSWRLKHIFVFIIRTIEIHLFSLIRHFGCSFDFEWMQREGWCVHSNRSTRLWWDGGFIQIHVEEFKKADAARTTAFTYNQQIIYQPFHSFINRFIHLSNFSSNKTLKLLVSHKCTTVVHCGDWRFCFTSAALHSIQSDGFQPTRSVTEWEIQTLTILWGAQVDALEIVSTRLLQNQPDYFAWKNCFV